MSQVKPSNCFRCLEKLVLPSIFDTSLPSLMMWNLQLSNNSSKWKNMTFLVESKHTLTPTNFQGSRPPAAQDLLPWVDHEYWLAHDQMTMLIVSSDLSIVPCSYNERTRVNTFISFTIYFWVCFAYLSCVHQRTSFFVLRCMFSLDCFFLVCCPYQCKWLTGLIHIYACYKDIVHAIFRCSMLH